MKPTVELSVLIPVRNARQTIESALTSITCQTDDSTEIVLVDDESTDGTSEFCTLASGRDPRIRVFSNPGRGIVDALNAGLIACQGRLVARMDADDEALPQRLAIQRAFLDSHPEIAVLGGAAEVVVDGKPTGWIERPSTDPAALVDDLLRGPALLHPTVMFRRDVVRRCGGYRSAFVGAEDYDLWLRIAEASGIASLGDVLLRYRVSSHQDSTRLAVAQLWSTIAARHCSWSRRERGIDPTPFSGQTDRTWLVNQGFSAPAIDLEVLHGLAHRAWWFGQLGAFGAAESILDQIRTLQVDRRVRRTRLSTWARLKARMGLAQHRPLAVLRFGLLALCVAPGRLLPVVRSLVRRRACVLSAMAGPIPAPKIPEPTVRARR